MGSRKMLWLDGQFAFDRTKRFTSTSYTTAYTWLNQLTPFFRCAKTLTDSSSRTEVRLTHWWLIGWSWHQRLSRLSTVQVARCDPKIKWSMVHRDLTGTEVRCALHLHTSNDVVRGHENTWLSVWATPGASARGLFKSTTPHTKLVILSTVTSSH